MQGRAMLRLVMNLLIVNSGVRSLRGGVHSPRSGLQFPRTHSCLLFLLLFLGNIVPTILSENLADGKPENMADENMASANVVSYMATNMASNVVSETMTIANMTIANMSSAMPSLSPPAPPLDPHSVFSRSPWRTSVTVSYASPATRTLMYHTISATPDSSIKTASQIAADDGPNGIGIGYDITPGCEQGDRGCAGDLLEGMLRQATCSFYQWWALPPTERGSWHGVGVHGTMERDGEATASALNDLWERDWPIPGPGEWLRREAEPW